MESVHDPCDSPECVWCQPTLNTPYEPPERHWKTVDNRTVNQITPERRPTRSHMPLGRTPAPVQMDLYTGDSEIVGRLRNDVSAWRDKHWPGATLPTARLLEYWARPAGQGPSIRLFYAQREAIETVVYLTEVAEPGHYAIRHLHECATGWNRGLLRVALHMATGTGKTTVMAALIAWYAVNRGFQRHRHGGLARNVDGVVIIAPGLTIRDRLQVLDPTAHDNLYDNWRLLPTDLRPRLNGFTVHITNIDAVQPRTAMQFEAVAAQRTGGGMLTAGQVRTLAQGIDETAPAESQLDVWRRTLPIKSGRLVVFNDEGHHCWERAAGQADGIWTGALHGLAQHPGIKLAQVVDLSATPMFINPAMTHRPLDTPKLDSSEPFPWIVAESGLMEAMESGLVKIPQPPMTDPGDLADAVRDLYTANGGRPLTTEDGRRMVIAALDLLVADYEATAERWADRDNPNAPHPVLIVVANTKKNALQMYRHLGGYLQDGHLIKGRHDILSNVPYNDCWPDECRERTMLVYSRETDAAQAETSTLNGGFIGLTKVTGSPAEQERTMRERLRTVGRPGTPGADIRCVVSVSMLTEGWDCPYVTHILGYRKFGTQLLCEQTMGRCLRRRDYDNTRAVQQIDTGRITDRYAAEYATVFGIPFETLERKPVGPPPPPPPIYRVRGWASRAKYRITVPCFDGYTAHIEGDTVSLDPAGVKPFKFQTMPEPVPDSVPVRGAIGEEHVIVSNSVDERFYCWQVARLLLQRIADKLDPDETPARYWRPVQRFAMYVDVVEQWLAHPAVNVTADDLRDSNRQEQVASAILDALQTKGGTSTIRGIEPRHGPVGRDASQWDFETQLRHTIPVTRSEVDHAACHSELEIHIAKSLDKHPEIAGFTRNHGPDRWEIPYRINDRWARYVPDFVARSKSGGEDACKVLIVEGKGRPDAASEAKARWTQDAFVPAANAWERDGGSRRTWQYLEIGPSENIDQVITAALR